MRRHHRHPGRRRHRHDHLANRTAAQQYAALEPSHLALEGYINARVFAEALRRAGRNPTRSSFIDATWSTKNLDLGGFAVNFSESAVNASRFVELTMVSKNGRFIR